MNLGARRRAGRTSRIHPQRALLLCTVLYCSCYLGLTQRHPEDVDILQKLGLKGEKPSRSVPAGVIPFRSGVILNQRAHIEAPSRSLFPAAVWPNLALVVSVRSHRVNSAFLFTLLSSQRRLLLGLQLVPGNLVLHTGSNTSVALPYEPHDGRWHQLAVGVDGQTVTLYASCGEQRVHADFGWDGEEGLELRGSFLLGRTGQQEASAHFEGAVCQLDLVPSAQAAHNYCRYIKKQCREADTYRPNLPPLLPILPRDPHTTTATPKTGKKPTRLSLAKSAAAAASAVRYVAPTPTKRPSPRTVPTPPLGTVMPATVQLGLASPPPKGRTETVTAPLRTRAPPTKPPRPPTSHASNQKPSKAPPTKLPPTKPPPTKPTLTKPPPTKPPPTKPKPPSTKPPPTKPKPTLTKPPPTRPPPTKPKPTPTKPTPTRPPPTKPKPTPTKPPPTKPPLHANPKNTIVGTSNKKTASVPATTSTKSTKTKPSAASLDRGIPKKPQPTTTRKAAPKPKVPPSKATPSRPRTNSVKGVPSKPTAPKVSPSKPTPARNTKPASKPTRPAQTTRAPVTQRPTGPWSNPVTPAATDGFVSWEVWPTQFSLLAGPIGQKGDAGPSVSTCLCCVYIPPQGGDVS
ncbi:collagen alpha-1(XXVII) chain A-like [Antennarius striatus]|uniref:collagen alpha-1(XXVII) chain A-like n=1 Tax=Antennarius striatus TaxID=241820 RepID=UPI0035AF6935